MLGPEGDRGAERSHLVTAVLLVAVLLVAVLLVAVLVTTIIVTNVLVLTTLLELRESEVDLLAELVDDLSDLGPNLVRGGLEGLVECSMSDMSLAALGSPFSQAARSSEDGVSSGAAWVSSSRLRGAMMWAMPLILSAVARAFPLYVESKKSFLTRTRSTRPSPRPERPRLRLVEAERGVYSAAFSNVSRATEGSKAAATWAPPTSPWAAAPGRSTGATNARVATRRIRSSMSIVSKLEQSPSNACHILHLCACRLPTSSQSRLKRPPRRRYPRPWCAGRCA